MKKYVYIALAVLLPVFTTDASAQSFLKRIGNAVERGVEKAVEKQVTKEVEKQVSKGFDKLDEHPDMYPYFQPLYNFDDGFNVLSPENPIQVIMVLQHIIEDCF